MYAPGHVNPNYVTDTATGDVEAARTAYEEAAARTTSLPEQRYLEAKADALR